MIPFILALLLLFQCAAAEVEPVSAQLLRIDVELMLENYKLIRAEHLKAELQLKLRQIDEEKGDDETRQREYGRLHERAQRLQGIADELRAKALVQERELSKATASPAVSASRSSGVTGGADQLSKRMLGTWELVSFADGRVSTANVGELKFIGDRHWSVSRLDPRNGKLDYHMGGTYTLDGDEYVETIEYGTGGPIGETFTYKLSVEGDTFTQMGSGNPWSLVFKRAK